MRVVVFYLEINKWFSRVGRENVSLRWVEGEGGEMGRSWIMKVFECFVERFFFILVEFYRYGEVIKCFLFNRVL